MQITKDDRKWLKSRGFRKESVVDEWRLAQDLGGGLSLVVRAYHDGAGWCALVDVVFDDGVMDAALDGDSLEAMSYFGHPIGWENGDERPRALALSTSFKPTAEASVRAVARRAAGLSRVYSLVKWRDVSDTLLEVAHEGG